MTALHSDWTDRWAPELRPGNLRRTLIETPRNWSRIERNLLWDLFEIDMDLEEIEATAVLVGERVARRGDELHFEMGLAWCAPALATSLRPLEAIDERMSDRAAHKTIMRHRFHADPEAIDMPRGVADIMSEGRRCYGARLAADGASVLERVALRWSGTDHWHDRPGAMEQARLRIADVVLAGAAGAAP